MLVILVEKCIVYCVSNLPHLIQDFSTSSLQGEVALEMKQVMEQDDIRAYQISERKRWEQK